MADGRAKFLSGNLFGHVATMSLLVSVGLVAVFLVDFVDMIFISMLGKAELAAAVGYAGAILFFTTSFGIGLGIAAGALVARALGQGDMELARERTTHALCYGAIFGVVFAILVFLSLDPLVHLVGAQGETADLAVHFLQIVVPSVPFLMLGMMGSAILRAHGDARRAMMATIAGGIVNAILDPILIFGFELDLTGAALASFVARGGDSLYRADADCAPLWRHRAAQAGGHVARLVSRVGHCRACDFDASGDAGGAGLCHARDGGIWRRRGRGNGDCQPHDAGGFCGDIRAVGGGGAGHRPELWRGRYGAGQAHL